MFFCDTNYENTLSLACTKKLKFDQTLFLKKKTVHRFKVNPYIIIMG